MSSSLSNCFYHPSTSAVTTCFRCNKPICQSDSDVYDVNIYDYEVSKDICMPCFAIVTEKDAESKFGVTTEYIFLVVWSIIILILFFPLLIFSYLIYRNIHNNQKQKFELVGESKKRLEYFLKTTDLNNEQLQKDLTIITCFNCGRVLDNSDLYCKTCGDSLAEDELD